LLDRLLQTEEPSAGGVHHSPIFDDIFSCRLREAAELAFPCVNDKSRFFADILSEDRFLQLKFLALFMLACVEPGFNVKLSELNGVPKVGAVSCGM
jgi:hypothetical protein